MGAANGNLGEAIPMGFRNSRCTQFLTTTQVADMLNIAPRTVCLWAECGEIPGIKLGRHWRFSEESIRHWIETRSGTEQHRRPSTAARTPERTPRRPAEPGLPSPSHH
ncbi:MAG: helix-turn-helix domain-containing protein [Bryobacterales bacterium]|nr:helix-turn-helix domain-containing protein [Bryobacterales bacterium]